MGTAAAHRGSVIVGRPGTDVGGAATKRAARSTRCPGAIPWDADETAGLYSP